MEVDISPMRRKFKLLDKYRLLVIEENVMLKFLVKTGYK